MRLTTFTDYSLRVLIYLAAEANRRITIAEIAEAFDIAENHLTKVVHFLGKQGWISTVRGKGGGMMLALPPDEISVGKVVRDTEGAAMPAECFAPDGSDCVIARCCRLKLVLREAVDGFYAVLDSYTLADITRNKQALSSVLHFHRSPASGTAREGTVRRPS